MTRILKIGFEIVDQKRKCKKVQKPDHCVIKTLKLNQTSITDLIK